MIGDEETTYSMGARAANLAMLRHVLGELGVTDPAVQNAAWVTERADVVQLLRGVCAEYGDNEWDDTLHLSDVIEKHLIRYMTVDERL